MIESFQDASGNGWNQKNEHENGKKHQQKHENTKCIAKITENELNCPNLLKILGLSWFFGPRTSWNFVGLRANARFP